MRKPDNEHSLRSQIVVMERVLAQAVVDGKPGQQIYAIRGKIIKLKKKLEYVVTNKWLSQ